MLFVCGLDHFGLAVRTGITMLIENELHVRDEADEYERNT